MKKFEEKKRKEFEELKLFIQKQVKEEYQKGKKIIKQEKIDIDTQENPKSKKDRSKNNLASSNTLNNKLVLGNKLALMSIKDFKEATSLDSKISSISDLIAMSNITLEKDFENNNNIRQEIEIKSIEKVNVQKNERKDTTILEEIQLIMEDKKRNETIVVFLDKESIQKFCLSMKGYEINKSKSYFTLEMRMYGLRCKAFQKIYFLNINVDEDINCLTILESEIKSIWPLILFFFEKWFTKFKAQLDLISEKSTDKTISELQKNVLFDLFRKIEKSLDLIKSMKEDSNQKDLNKRKSIFRVNNLKD